MANFKNLNNLLKHIQTKVIPDVLADEVYDVVVNTESKMVHREVYAKYQPFIYDRRGDEGGLSDPRNHIATFAYDSNEVRMFVQNTTTGKWNNQYIAGVIEYGHDNGYGEYDYPFNRDGTATRFLKPRPFIRKTKEELRSSSAHVKAFKDGLNKRGIRTT